MGLVGGPGTGEGPRVAGVAGDWGGEWGCAPGEGRGEDEKARGCVNELGGRVEFPGAKNTAGLTGPN